MKNTSKNRNSSLFFIEKTMEENGENPITELLKICLGVSEFRGLQGLHFYLNDIIGASILAMLSGAEDFTGMAEFCKDKKDFLCQYFRFSKKTPSHDQFRWIYANICPEEFMKCFVDWTEIVSKMTKGEVIPIDGKVLRATRQGSNVKSALCIVSAWASSNGMSLGQVKVDKKSNEKTAIPKLLDLLEIKGGVVSIDAMGTHPPIAQKIIDKEADYLLALKKNNKNLFLEVENFFNNFKGTELIHDFASQKVEAHGRIEVRNCYLITALDYIPDTADWPGLKSLVCIESQRTIGAKTTNETRYYLGSFVEDAQTMLAKTIKHWSIENNLHWRLDVTYLEDKCRTKFKNCPENLSIARKITLAILDADKQRLGGRNKRLKLGWNENNLISLIQSFINTL